MVWSAHGSSRNYLLKVLCMEFTRSHIESWYLNHSNMSLLMYLVQTFGTCLLKFCKSVLIMSHFLLSFSFFFVPEILCWVSVVNLYLNLKVKKIYQILTYFEILFVNISLENLTLLDCLKAAEKNTLNVCFKLYQWIGPLKNSNKNKK